MTADTLAPREDRGRHDPAAPARHDLTASASPAPQPNLSLRGDGGADGSTKADGTSFKDVRDGDLGTAWSPVGRTGEIAVKWQTPVTLSRIKIRETAAAIVTWQVRDHDSGSILATGTGAGTITFKPVTLRKIAFVILSATSTPRVAEFETFVS
ncbi:hypothetical protein [Paractinoplanes lichenicola]|uniref:Discoidin domain-containing protein n=1 Tax=Paractinoplanes lichenicola TaxID=2802976 RepID=A0ABS1W086_9ACTN|nr:hypothetical protein [Actinoplanes lichenicola]MBL7260124.1 hypothetical protein [Actinoplanes lichenicola]